MAININELQRLINRNLQEYSFGIGEALDKEAERIAKEGVKRLKLTSPLQTGSYKKGWRAKRINGVWTVHNATDYQLTHLLEKGHAKVGGGRVSPQKHIEPVERQMIDEFVREVEKVISP